MNFRRRPIAFLVTLAVGAGLGGMVSLALASPDVSPGPIVVSADQRTLTAVIDGSCATGRLHIDEDAHAVTVVLRLDTPFGAGACGMNFVAARLRSPLGRRRLVDGVAHVSLPPFNGATIPRPAFLPDGFVHRYDRVTLPSAGAGAGGPACVQVFTQPDSYEEMIWITQRPGAAWPPPTGVTARPVTVHGRPGLAMPGGVAWTENGELITVRSHTFAYATVDTAALLRIAESLG